MFTTYQKALSNGFLPLLWLSNVIAAPVAEEILFRGFIYRGLLHTRLRSFGAVLLTAAAFAAIHQQYDAVGVAAIFVLGLVLGWLRQRTGSTIVPMFVHAIQNLGATALAAGLLV
jgi:CAAX protease family protein